ncbi:hypothetical protein MHO82_23645 [Vibrio sp. Of7-15]|uniref:hypothetical protein n=1 Tax=Vibrio sp. Of7-15 TaxID=2724879 RepID=UPI001EF24C72|nr:hypothetical protein [Vibrio sp. Of7-15]MCG7499866.1 hypothetical protein [Vibrio sp. Of7-15]
MQKLVFKSGRSLIKSDLDFLITPQELNAQFQRARHSNDIIRQLPSSVSTRLGKVEARVTLPLIQRIEQQLQMGQWVALGTRQRNTPIPQNTFRKMPELERAICNLNEAPERIVKAGFKPVVNDYVLPPVHEYVAVEPGPEHKIVVEFAGQWSSNSASLSLGKTDTQNEKVTKPRPDPEVEHRSLAEFKALEEEPKNLYLNVPLSGYPNPLKLLLAENVQPVKKDHEMDEWDTVLIPAIPMYYTSADKNKAEAKLYPSGYLYVVWKNKVWREIFLDGKGYFRDIDLAYYRGNTTSTAKKMRHVDIQLIDKEHQRFFDLEPFTVSQNGAVVFEGVLDEYGEAIIHSLTEETVTVTLTEHPETPPFELTTVESPVSGGVKQLREAEGAPLPHVWLPYKIQGEAQSDLFAYYSAEQLSLTELNKLEESPAELGVSLAELENYSAQQAFDSNADIIAPLCMPDIGTEDMSHQGLIASQLDKNIASMYLNEVKPVIRIRYQATVHVDHSDDYFEMRCIDKQWQQRAYLRECEYEDKTKAVKLVCFSGWPPEVEQVDLVRFTRGGDLNEEYIEVMIHQQVPIQDYLA